ncbi:MAG: DUF2157 domain-containing protein [Betaproteobacteria bacterium]
MNTVMLSPAMGREEIDQLTEAGHLNAAARDAALVLAGVMPNARKWQQFLSRLFLLLGVTFLVAAIGFFIAYNWDVMGRFAKIGLLEAGLVAAVVVALRGDRESLMSRAALLAAVTLTGPLLAFVGQTYQTGADTYELFRAWALLVLPWVIVARWRPLWCAWLLLANLWLALYFGEAWRPLATSFFAMHAALAHLVFNAAFLVLMEAWGSARVAGSGRTVERLALVFALLAASVLYLAFLLDNHERQLWQLVAAIVVFPGVWAAYRLWRVDVAALALWSFAAIIAAVVTLGKLLVEAHAETAAFLFCGTAAIGLSAWAASWLRGIHRDMETA